MIKLTRCRIDNTNKIKGLKKESKHRQHLTDKKKIQQTIMKARKDSSPLGCLWSMAYGWKEEGVVSVHNPLPLVDSLHEKNGLLLIL